MLYLVVLQLDYYIFVKSNLDISMGISTSLSICLHPVKELGFVEFQVSSCGAEYQWSLLRIGTAAYKALYSALHYEKSTSMALDKQTSTRYRTHPSRYRTHPW